MCTRMSPLGGIKFSNVSFAPKLQGVAMKAEALFKASEVIFNRSCPLNNTSIVVEHRKPGNDCGSGVQIKMSKRKLPPNAQHKEKDREKRCR